MTQEERKKKALELINSNKIIHYETSYGPDCQIHEFRREVVTINIVKRAIEIALGKIK